jgi:error-prone DNA polymerase
MLTCIRKAFDIAREHYGLDLTLANIPQDDPKVYDMICKADTIGVFQIESRAQQSMLPRLRPRNFYDLVIEVAIVRPGPIQGDMVHPYLRRRNKEEPVEYPSEEIKGILERTLGVPLFQEQAMKIAIVAAGFTPTEADGLRRSMATFKFKGVVSQWQEKLVNGMVQRGYAKEYAERVFRQLEGFGSYGFPESHAASFALLVYVSSWLKCHYPDVFACALLNSLPMGFYQPAQLVQDARNHGVEIRPIDVNYSGWDHQLEEAPKPPEGGLATSQASLIGVSALLSESSIGWPRSEASANAPLGGLGVSGAALRLGFRLIKGIREEDIRLLIAARSKPYTSVNALRDARLSDAALERLADADAFRSIGLDRRQALWEVSTKDRPTALFAGQSPPDAIDEEASLPLLQPSEHVVQDYATTALSLKAHPVSFIRQQLEQLHIVCTKDLSRLRNGQPVKVAGLVLVRQRPGTAKGVWFMTIEDETGFANLVLFPQVAETFRRQILSARLFIAEGTVQVEGSVIHVIVKAGYDGSKLLRHLTRTGEEDLPVLTLSRADEKSPVADQRAEQGNLFSQARNFK